MKIIIGAASTSQEGWLTTDLPVLDALKPQNWRQLFSPGDIDRILAEHVIEHWTEEAFRRFLKVVRPFLARDGFIRLAVPDGLHPEAAYTDRVRPGGFGDGADDHKLLYDYRLITSVLSDMKYDFRLLEYFDEAGRFHLADWDPEDGFVRRSAGHDSRNKSRPLTYTSLIVDAWPRRDAPI